jgi:hypothetical protein
VTSLEAPPPRAVIFPSRILWPVSTPPKHLSLVKDITYVYVNRIGRGVEGGVWGVYWRGEFMELHSMASLYAVHVSC